MFTLTLTLAAAEEQAEEEDATEEEVEQEGVTLQIVDKGVTEYVIVRDYKAGPSLVQAVNTLAESFKVYLNCDIRIVECYSDREVEEEAPIATEILVGATNRPESAAAIDGKKVGDYATTVVGRKLVIAGGSDDATANAVTRFLGGFVYKQGNKYDVANRGSKLSLSVNSVDAATYDFNTNYSYNKVGICNARIDSYLITYAGKGVLSNTYKAFAEEFQTYVYQQAGYELDVKKDTQVVKADYKILIGDTTFTDSKLVDAIGDDEYYISVQKTDTGATMTILFGREAYDTAMAAYKEIMPSFNSPVNFHISSGYVVTNMK